MPLSPEQIAHVAMMTGIADHAIRVLSQRWAHKAVPAGTVLWRPGDDASRMVIVLQGTVGVWTPARHTAELGPGHLLGEVGAFFPRARHHRGAKVLQDAVLAVIPRPILLHMRESTPEAYRALLGRALEIVSERRAASYTWLGERAEANAEPPTRGPRRNLAIVTDRWITARLHKPPDPLRDFLEQLPAFRGVSPAIMQNLVECFEEEPLREEHPIFKQGDKADTAYLLTEGVLELLRGTPDGGAVRVGLLKPFAATGLTAHVGTVPRATTCVARERGWAYALSPGGYARLRVEARTLWQELCLRALGLDLARVDELLARAVGG